MVFMHLRRFMTASIVVINITISAIVIIINIYVRRYEYFVVYY